MEFVSPGWNVVERTVEHQARWKLRDRGMTDAEIEAAFGEDEAVIAELPPAIVDAALAAELQPSPFGRVLPVYDEAA